jgi:polyisoprenyl-phosphate glycosyltransferase
VDPRLAIIVPCFNEEAVLREAAKRLTEQLKRMITEKMISTDSFIYFVDDGSKDRTWEIIQELHLDSPYIKGLKLSRNFGHQNALLSGMMNVKNRVDCIISIDADLQDDIAVISQFVNGFRNGMDVIYGVRKLRDTDTYFKKYTAILFYKLMSALGVKIIYNHADYRLCSKRVLEQLAQFEEVNLFLRGIFPLIGFKSDIIYYDRTERFAGESKYPFRKMLSFAFDGLTSFSVVPLRFVTLIGLSLFTLSLFMSAYVVFAATYVGGTVPGWASTLLPIYFIGGVQIFSIGLLGEYIGKIYKEVKSRPKYIIDREVF